MFTLYKAGHYLEFISTETEIGLRTTVFDALSGEATALPPLPKSDKPKFFSLSIFDFPCCQPWFFSNLLEGKCTGLQHSIVRPNRLGKWGECNSLTSILETLHQPCHQPNSWLSGNKVEIVASLI